MIVVSDTTPIISLLKINGLGLLKDLFGQVIIPRAVYNELTENEEFSEEADIVMSSSFIKVEDVLKRDAVDLIRRATGLDLGESEAIIYTDETKADLLLMDEAKGRKVARQMGLNVTGTIGILIESYDEDLIGKNQILEAIDIMKNNGRYISNRLYDLLLNKIGK